MCYTETELQAQDYADKAFREVIKVAKEFATQVGCRYERTSNCWFSTSSFEVDDWRKIWNTVHNLYSGENNEAWECTHAIEAAWNYKVAELYDTYDKDLCKKVTTDDDDAREYYDKRVDLDLDALRHLRNEVGKIIENWLDAAAEAAYDEFIEDSVALTQLDR